MGKITSDEWKEKSEKKKTDQGMIILHPRSQWRGNLSKMSIVAFIGDFDFLFFPMLSTLRRHFTV